MAAKKKFNLIIKGEVIECRYSAYANTIGEAVAKADGWATMNFPGQQISLYVEHKGYSSKKSAERNGAIFPF